MILQAVHGSTGKIIALATHLGPLAAECARVYSDGYAPRLQVFESRRDDRWYRWEKERELAAILLDKHDCMTDPTRERVKETALWTAHNLPKMDQDALIARVAWSFGHRKLGHRTGSYAWDCYLASLPLDPAAEFIGIRPVNKDRLGLWEVHTSTQGRLSLESGGSTSTGSTPDRS